MHQIRYKITIQYKDFDNQLYNISYSVFANNEFDAEKIANELFYLDYGYFNDMKYYTEPVVASKSECTLVNTKLVESFGVVTETFASLNYRDFMKCYINFDGKYLVLKSNYASFWFRFMDLRCKAIWNNHNSYISEDEVIVYLNDNRVFSVRNRLCDIYKAY